MTPEQLAAIRERAENATKGPWTWGDNRDGLGNKLHPAEYPGKYRPIADFEFTDDADAEFIAAAREDVPKLLDHVDFLGKKLEVQKEISRQNFEEWKKVADEEEARADRLAARLAAVRELHPPVTYDDDEQYCNYCVEAFPWGGESVPYPCPTIQALEGDPDA